MSDEQIRNIARDVLIAVAGLIALAAASVFVRPNATAVEQSRPQAPETVPATRTIVDKAVLQADYLDICRAAGL